MCGIAGSINFRLNASALDRDLIHRGPDEKSLFEEGELQFFHYRLSILDISGGKQPMHKGSCTIIFNGEIYNHQDVRNKYALTGQTSSDTETILMAYQHAGPACLNEFDGMFAIAILDRDKNMLFLARDRAGKKPLYYYCKKNSFVFASELNALKSQVKANISDVHIQQYLRYGAFHGEATPYVNVKELLPGAYAEIDINTADVKLAKWWSIEPFYKRRLSIDLTDAVEQTDHALRQAIKRRLESSDLEVGSFLSGGIDSGLVTSIASEMRPGLRTFTVSFSGVYDEAPLAKQVATKLRTNHTEINISFDNLQHDIEKILSNYGEPFYDDSAIPSYYVSREARKHLTVILNGDGADEIFGGYRRYVPFTKYDFFSKSGLITSLSSIIKGVIPFSRKKQSLLNYMYRLADLTSNKGLEMYYSASTDIFCGYFDSFIKQDESFGKNLEQLFQDVRKSGMSGLQKIMYMDFNAILPDILLVKMDIASMANSLEGRSPFLSKELLELAPGLPDDFKVKGKRTKVLLRQLATRYLPNKIVGQPKRGFEVPLQQWVNNELKEIITDYLASPGSFASGYVKADFIKGLLDNKIRVHAEKRAKMLYTLFALEVWYKKCAVNVC